MARPKKVIKAKEPVRIRQKKLKGGSISLYLDIMVYASMSSLNFTLCQNSHPLTR